MRKIDGIHFICPFVGHRFFVDFIKVSVDSKSFGFWQALLITQVISSSVISAFLPRPLLSRKEISYFKNQNILGHFRIHYYAIQNKRASCEQYSLPQYQFHDQSANHCPNTAVSIIGSKNTVSPAHLLPNLEIRKEIIMPPIAQVLTSKLPWNIQ